MKRNNSTALAVIAAVVVIATAVISRHNRTVQRSADVQALANAVAVLNHSPAVVTSGLAAQGALERVSLAVKGSTSEGTAEALAARYLSTAQRLNHGRPLTAVTVTIRVHRGALGGAILYTGVKKPGTMHVVWHQR